MTSILVTGGTGTLGRPTVERLRRAGHSVRILSRTPGPDRHRGNVTTGKGLESALMGVDTVVHLATSASRKDVTQTLRVIEASRAAGVTHVVYQSIVGVDAIPFSYYRAKHESERTVEESGIPFTILRATQFHDFIAQLIALQGYLPVLFAINAPDQPIAVDEVAARLVELVDAGPSGRVDDIGGPQQLPVRELLLTWTRATGSRRAVWTLPLVGQTIRAFQAGHHLTVMPGYGRETFAEYVARTERGTNGT